MHFLPPVTHVIHGFPRKSQRPPRSGGRCKLRRRRALPPLYHSNQMSSSINMTPANGVGARGYFRQPRTDVWSRDAGQPTKLTQLAPAHFSFLLRQRPPAAGPRFRRGREDIQVLRKALLGLRPRESILRRQFRAHVRRRLLLNLSACRNDLLKGAAL